MQVARVQCHHQSASLLPDTLVAGAIPDTGNSCSAGGLLAGPTGLTVSLEMARVARYLSVGQSQSGTRSRRGICNAA